MTGLKMMDVCRRLSCMWLAGLFVVCLFGMCLAQPDQMMGQQMVGHPMGVPIEVLESGHGFALLGNESHIMRLNVEALCPLEPMQVRNLMASNKSLDEIRDDIRTKRCNTTYNTTYRGSLMLDRSIYPLVNISISSANNSTTIGADVLASNPELASEEPFSAGRITLVISPSDGGIVGRGQLELNRTERVEKYTVLLDMHPQMHGYEKNNAGDRGR